MDYEETEPQCAFDVKGAERAQQQLQPFFEGRSLTGRPLSSRYAPTVFGGLSGFGGFSTTRLFIPTIVHVVGIPSQTGGFKPIVDQAWIDTLFRRANEIWSQACIELVPYFTGTLVTNFSQLNLSVGLGYCHKPSVEGELLEPHDIKVPGAVTVNVYLVDSFGGNVRGCGSPVTGHVFLRTDGQDPETMGRVFAHEMGHVLLNPLGLDDSAEPNHLMFHPPQHPEIPPGSRDGLFLSDCIGAQARARADLLAFARPGGIGSPNEAISCQMNPSLGNNLVVVATNVASG